VTVAKEIELEDKFENMGAQMVKEVASKTSDVAGDGTTTATVLAQAIFREGLRKLVAAGMNPMDLKRGIDRPSRRSSPTCTSCPTPARSRAPARSPRSARSRPTATRDRQDDRRRHGQGRQGRRHHGRGVQGPRDRAGVVEGMQFDRGYLSPYFVTDAERMECRPRGPYILIHEKKISSMQELLRCSRRSSRSGKPLLIIAEDVEGEALARSSSTRSAARFRSRRQGPGLRRPPQGDAAGHRDPHRRQVIAEELGLKLENVSLDGPGPGRSGRHHQGQHDDHRRRATRTTTSRPASHQIKAQIEAPLRLRPREAAGAPGQAGRRRRVIKVGAATEVEMKEKKAPRRGRHARDPRGRRGGHRRRWRHSPHPRGQRPSTS
jgi:chaperonin GroEL